MFRERPTFTAEELAEISERYRAEIEPVEELAGQYGLTILQVPARVAPQLSTGSCERCGGVVQYRTRGQRASGQVACVECRHRNGMKKCPCRTCEHDRTAWQRRQAEEHRQELQTHFADFWNGYESEEHFRWAIGQLNPAQRLYLDYFFAFTSRSLTSTRSFSV